MGSGYLHPDEQSPEIYNESTMEPIMLIWPSHYYGHTLDTRILLFFLWLCHSIPLSPKRKKPRVLWPLYLVWQKPQAVIFLFEEPLWNDQWGPGLEKNLNSGLSFREVALKFCLPWPSLNIVLFIFSWQTTCLGAHWTRENSKLLVHQENVLFSDDLMTLFVKPCRSNFVMDKHPTQGE